MSGTFQVEYAKSNRSGCKACSSKIGKDELRIGKMGTPHTAPLATRSHDIRITGLIV